MSQNKTLEGPHAARKPQFGHRCYIELDRTLGFGARNIYINVIDVSVDGILTADVIRKTMYSPTNAEHSDIYDSDIHI